MAAPSHRKSRSSLLALLILLLGLTPSLVEAQSASVPTPNTQRNLEKATTALSKGSYKKALGLFDKANQAAGGNLFEAYLGTAQAHRCLQEYKLSLDFAQSAFMKAADPVDKARAVTMIGVGYFEIPISELGDSVSKQQANYRTKMMRAESLFLRALQISSNEYRTPHYYLGQLYMISGYPDQAISQLEKYLEQPDPSLLESANQTLSKLHTADAEPPAVQPPVHLDGDSCILVP